MPTYLVRIPVLLVYQVHQQELEDLALSPVLRRNDLQLLSTESLAHVHLKPFAQVCTHFRVKADSCGVLFKGLDVGLVFLCFPFVRNYS